MPILLKLAITFVVCIAFIYLLYKVSTPKDMYYDAEYDMWFYIENGNDENESEK